MVLTVLAALASAIITCGSAMAASRKPGKSGKNKGWGKAKPSSAKRPPAPAPSKYRQQGTSGEPGSAGIPRPVGGMGEGDLKTGRRPPALSESTDLARSWPEWKFPEMMPILERELLFAQRMTKMDSLLAAADAWECLRALGRLLLGPGDPRVWAALARSARALACHPQETFRPGSPENEQVLNFFSRAAVLAAGAAEALRDPSLKLPPASAPGPRPAGSSAGAGDAGEAGGTSPDREDGGMPAETAGQEWDRAGELASAEETLRRLLAKAPSAGGPPPATARSFAEAMLPGNSPEAGKGCLPSSGELRAMLDAAEGPGGPGPGSREALVLRSLLGAEIWDTGDWSRTNEALELLKEASRGLDELAGESDPDSLDARERRARRLGGLYGHAAVIPRRPAVPTPNNVIEAEKLFRSLEELAPAGPKGESLRLRAAFFAAGISPWEEPSTKDQLRMLKALDSYASSFLEEERSPGLEMARRDFDLAELLRRSAIDLNGTRFAMNSLSYRRNLLGCHHPETAASLARMGDALFSDDSPEKACAYWALALEALEGQGERCETFRADIETRIGIHLHSTASAAGHAEAAVPLLDRACGRLRKELGDTSQLTQETTFHLACALFWAKRHGESEEIFSTLVSLLDGAPPRKDPDPRRASDATVLYASLAGKAAAMRLRGNRSGLDAFVRHPTALPSRTESSYDASMRSIGGLFLRHCLEK
jgi:hypothetical protein